ncbi:MAG: rhomboid family intramembrane serine protease [Dehalococcoidia bacterium]|nr:rhomboid family intramembrane serine protease [Dehalococcoidia bacterium]MSQ35191.1 rhomboid family intramembrane serine protease [Dehalococcoidia bacterium]
MNRSRYRGAIGPALGLRESPVTWAIIAVNILLWIGLTITGGSENTINLYHWGAKYGGGPDSLLSGILDGEWWRLIVPVFLHAGIFHLVANTFGLVAFGGTIERIFGSVSFAAIYLLSGVLGNVASLWWGPDLGVGASGAVFGMIGAFGAYLLLNRQHLGQIGRQSLTTVGFLIVINVLFGLLITGVDNAAHVGGLLGGTLIGFALAPQESLAVPSGPIHMGPVIKRVKARPGVAQIAVVVAVACALAALIAYWATQFRGPAWP